MSEEKPGISLLGQRINWPESWPATCTAFGGCAALVLIFAIVFVWAKPGRVKEVAIIIETGIYKANGESSRDEDVVLIYRFWTPNMHTKRDVLGLKDNVAQDQINRKLVPQYYWATDCEPGELEAENESFLKELRNFQPVGIDISPMIGVGTSDRKRGYVWSMSISRKNPVSRAQFLNIYRQRWKRDDEIWLEQYNVQSTKTQ